MTIPYSDFSLSVGLVNKFQKEQRCVHNDYGGGEAVVVVVEEEEVWFDVGDSHELWRLVIPLFLVEFTDEGRVVTNGPTD